MKFKSWWQVIWMNKIWRTPKILRHFLLKQVLVFACPWINKNVPLVRSNSLALKNLQDQYYRRAMSVRRKHESVPPRLILKRRFQLKKSISRQENIEKKLKGINGLFLRARLSVRNIPKFKDRANWSHNTFQPMRRRACVYQQTNQNIAPVIKNFQNNGQSRTELTMSLQYSSRFHI